MNIFLKSIGLILLSLSARSEEPKLFNLLHKANRHKFVVSSGKLVLVVKSGGEQRISTGFEDDKFKESLVSSLVDDKPCVEYKYYSPAESIELAVDEHSGVVIKHVIDGSSLIYEQSRRVALTVDGVETKASTIWHLLRESKCDRLLPILEKLQKFRLLERLKESEFHSVQDYDLSHLLDKLDDDEFGVRNAADYELRQGGRHVAIFLSTIDMSERSVEVRSRVSRIIANSEGHDNDLPSQIATILRYVK